MKRDRTQPVIQTPRPLDEWAGQINRAFGHMPYGGSAGFLQISVYRANEWNPDPPQVTAEEVCRVVVTNLERLGELLRDVAADDEKRDAELRRYRDIMRSLKDLAGLIGLAGAVTQNTEA